MTDDYDQMITMKQVAKNREGGPSSTIIRRSGFKRR